MQSSSSLPIEFDTWFHRHCPALLNVLAVPYGLATRIRSEFFRRGWRAQRRLACPVISVGNLTVGGTGKTPVVIWLANRLRTKGWRVGILSRGYGRSSASRFHLVSDGERVIVGPREAGDEPSMMARRCPGVLVAVGNDRYELARWVLDRKAVDCFILDDGFQHLRLHRDVNLLLMDAQEINGDQKVLPAGRLREPLSAAKRATLVGITRAEQVNDKDDMLRRLQGILGPSVAPVYIAFPPTRLVHVRTSRSQPLSWVKGQGVLIFSGIGNPRAFRETVSRLGADILDELVLPDHCRYTPALLADIRSRRDRVGAKFALTTEKDAVKLESLLEEGDDIWSVCLDLEFTDGGERVERLLDGLVGKRAT